MDGIGRNKPPSQSKRLLNELWTGGYSRLANSLVGYEAFTSNTTISQRTNVCMVYLPAFTP